MGIVLSPNLGRHLAYSTAAGLLFGAVREPLDAHCAGIVPWSIYSLTPNVYGSADVGAVVSCSGSTCKGQLLMGWMDAHPEFSLYFVEPVSSQELN